MNYKNIPYKIKKSFSNGIQLSTCITWRCNLRCSYCLVSCVNGNMPEKEDVDIIELVKFIKYFPLKINEVSVTGGEPTLHDDFAIYVNQLLAMGKNVVVYSNLHNLWKLKLLEKSPFLRIYATYHHEKESSSSFKSKLLTLQKDYNVICKSFVNTNFSEKRDILPVDSMKKPEKNVLFVDTKLRLYKNCYDRVFYNLKVTKSNKSFI